MSIEGLQGREPIGAVLTVGHKGPKGNPEHTDRFYLVMPQEVDGVRAPHPAFKPFNEALPERRVTIKGNLVHAHMDECFEFNLRAQVLPGLQAHPNKAAACSGDGAKARRWDGKEFKDIVCPNEKCQYRVSGGDKPTPCKPWMRLLFRIRWADGSPLPPMLVKFTSGSWNTVGFMLGFFEHIDVQAKNMGLEGYSLYGFPFSLTLTKKKRRGEAGGRAFPIVQVTPEADVVEFLLAQQAKLKELGAVRRPMALLDVEQQDYSEQAADNRMISGPVIDIPSE
jgi:hypothetical protein